jgi:hypothetical protein
MAKKRLGFQRAKALWKPNRFLAIMRPDYPETIV